MPRKWWIVSGVALVGFFVGSGIGIAVGGGIAINGSIVVAGVAGLIAFLLVTEPKRSEPQAHEGGIATVETPDELARSGMTLLTHFASWSGSVLRALWNLEMRFLATICIMQFFQRFPVLFALLAIGLLVIFLPVGAVFVATGVAALLRDPKAETQFRVVLA